MARTQAADYDDRRKAIMATAARLYALHGFLGASIAQIAAAGETSKSLIYHYYPSKEDILFDVMDSHVQGLVDTALAVEAGSEEPRDKLRRLARDLMEHYEGAQSNQKVLLNELGNLPVDRRQDIVDRQRVVIDVVDRLLLAIRPDLAQDRPRRRTLTMLFFGMLNWTHTWFDPAGPIKSQTIADDAAEMFLSGLARPQA